MDILLSSVPLILTMFCAVGLVITLMRVGQVHNRSNRIMKAMLLTLEKSRENSTKLDQISTQVESSKSHQQKIFDHHRVILGSLNGQLEKLDVMLKASENKTLSSDSENESPEVNTAYIQRSGKIQNYVKLNPDSLPKTENGLLLLEEVFKRRENSSKPNDNSKARKDPPRMLRENAERSKSALLKDKISNPEKRSTEEDHAPGSAASKRSILKLFSDQQAAAADSNEQYRRSA